MQNQNYQRLTNWEREEISGSLAAGMKQAPIARLVGRHPSTISREVGRYDGRAGYRAFIACQMAKTAAASRRKGKSRLAKQQASTDICAGEAPRTVVSSGDLRMPQKRVSSRQNHAHFPRSHLSIYLRLPRGELKRTLIKALRQEHAYRRKRKKGETAERRGQIIDMLSIEERPKEVADRSVPGHWEGDLILGKYKRSALSTLVERTTRYLILVPLGKNRDAVSVRGAYARAFRSIPAELKKTLTYDQGKEMSQHKLRFLWGRSGLFNGDSTAAREPHLAT